MTPSHLATLRAIAEAGAKEAPLPWSVQYDGDGARVLGVEDSMAREVIETDSGVYPPRGPVADFIVSAVNNHADLIARAERLEQLERAAKDTLRLADNLRRIAYRLAEQDGGPPEAEHDEALAEIERLRAAVAVTKEKQP